MKLKEDDYTQALDYSYVLLVAYSNTMEKCRALKQKKIKKQYEKAIKEMVELYQLIGHEGK